MRDVAHRHVRADRVVSVEDVIAVAAELAPEAGTWQAPGGALVLTAPGDAGRSVWVASADGTGSGDGDVVSHVEIVGDPDLAVPLARGLAGLVGGTEGDDTTVWPDAADPGPGWATRTPPEGGGGIDVVDAPLTRLTLGPWLYARRETAAAAGRSLVVRTPSGTRASGALRCAVAEGWVGWVRVGHEGGLDGVGAHPSDRADGATLRVQVVHAWGDEADVGLAAEAVLGAVVSEVSVVPGVSAGRAEARMGATEPLLQPWRRAAVGARTWLVGVVGAVGVGDGGPLTGMLTTTPTPAGLIEDLGLDVPPTMSPEAWWALLRPLRPAMLQVVDADGRSRTWVAAHLAAELGGTGPSGPTGVPDPEGYVTG